MIRWRQQVDGHTACMAWLLLVYDTEGESRSMMTGRGGDRNII
jgi:hypothetical protein